MPFTNDDLKRLKNELSRYETSWETHKLQIGTLDALLARLEAEIHATDVLQLHYESGVFDDLDEGDVALIVQALEARRKAAGK